MRRYYQIGNIKHIAEDIRMTKEQEALCIEALAILLAGYPLFICNNAMRIRKQLPDIEFYAKRKGAKIK